MDPLVYIQCDANSSPYSVSGEAAVRGFRYLGYDVRLFHPAALSTLPLSPDTVVVGGMGTVRAALEQIGARVPVHHSLPAMLIPFAGRECWRTTGEELLAANRFPVFVKPYEDSKVFTGRVVQNADELATLLQPRPDFPETNKKFSVISAATRDFLSEWRVFIVHGKPIGISHYQGDLLRFPASAVIRAVLGGYTGAPAGYSADFGITGDGRTVLVEVNDGYSLGAMGLADSRYAELLRARWWEMTGG